MAKPNYAFEKRQRDLAKKRNKEEKRLKKAAGKEAKVQESAGPSESPPTPEERPAEGGESH